MKKISTLLTLCFISTLASAQFGVQNGLVMAHGAGTLGKTVPLHMGMHFGVFYNLKQSPLSVGWRVNPNFYGKSKRNDMPFYREDYVHNYATIYNKHNISQNVFYLRYELNRNGWFAPFIEVGGGWAVYRSRWEAIDPNEGSNDDCEGYLESKVFYNTHTATANVSAGVNFKLHNLCGCCSGLWLTLAVDYARGGRVQHLNSKVNGDQFYYVSGDPAGVAPQPRHAGHEHSTASTQGEMSHEQYMAQSVYRARHELAQLRFGITWFWGGKCEK